MKWEFINCSENLPELGNFVLVKFDDDFIGIDRFIDGEWERNYSKFSKKGPIYKGMQRFFTSSSPQYWAPLPNQPERLNPKTPKGDAIV